MTNLTSGLLMPIPKQMVAMRILVPLLLKSCNKASLSSSDTFEWNTDTSIV